MSLSDKYVFWLFHRPTIPWIPPSSWASLHPRHNKTEIRPVTSQRPHSVQVQGRAAYLTLHPTLEMTKLSEEGTSKVRTGQKLGLLHQLASLWMQRKSSSGQLDVLLQWTHNDKKVNRLTASAEKVRVAWMEDPTSHSISINQSPSQSKAPTLFNSVRT